MLIIFPLDICFCKRNVPLDRSGLVGWSVGTLFYSVIDFSGVLVETLGNVTDVCEELLNEYQQ